MIRLLLVNVLLLMLTACASVPESTDTKKYELAINFDVPQGYYRALRETEWNQNKILDIELAIHSHYSGRWGAITHFNFDGTDNKYASIRLIESLDEINNLELRFKTGENETHRTRSDTVKKGIKYNQPVQFKVLTPTESTIEIHIDGRVVTYQLGFDINYFEIIASSSKASIKYNLTDNETAQ